MASKSHSPIKDDATPREKAALLCLSLFVHRYLSVIYGTKDLDLISISLLNEIAAHNLEPFVRGNELRFPKNEEEMKLMRGCNAFSLSEATGVPRETARRKIKQLLELGWIEKHNRKGLFITTRWMDRLTHEEGADLLGEFADTAGRIAKLRG
ncbi:MAG: hypothetical protein ACKOD5_10755 [Chthoniobacterales bacterium]